MEIDEIQFGFKPGCETTNYIFILRQLQEKRRFVPCVCKFGESF